LEKERRQLLIREIVSRHAVETQEALAEHLRRRGIHVTQATISRDIKELGLIKIPIGEGRYRYALPLENPLRSEERLRSMLRDVLVRVARVDNLIVLRTLPGNAHAVGVLIDAQEWEEILGTICGDDTCLLICNDHAAARTVERRLLERSAAVSGIADEEGEGPSEEGETGDSL